MKKRILTACSLLVGATGLALTTQSSAPVTCNVSITTTSGVIAPGSPGTINVTGDPGDYVLVMIDTVLGGSVLPYVGGVPIDLGQGPYYTQIFVRNETGTFSLSCDVDCSESAFFGTTFYLQAAAMDPVTKDVCISNISTLTWDDDGSTCGFEGCTPGYWRQPQHWDSWTAPYTPDTLFSDVFDDAFPGQTLLQVVDNPGGKLDTLGFHTVAALLNAASPDTNYAYSVQEVIDMFNAVYPGTGAEYVTLKNKFDAANNAGCPLN